MVFIYTTQVYNYNPIFWFSNLNTNFTELPLPPFNIILKFPQKIFVTLTQKKTVDNSTHQTIINTIWSLVTGSLPLFI